MAGYADTVGFDIDATLIIQAEGKWRYRDYVIGAFNRDMPYDQFVREQLACDEMTNWRRGPVYTPEIRDKLIATGFLRNAGMKRTSRRAISRSSSTACCTTPWISSAVACSG